MYSGLFPKLVLSPGLITSAVTKLTANEARNITTYSATVLSPILLSDDGSAAFIMPVMTAQIRTGMIIILIRLRYMSPMTFVSTENCGAKKPSSMPAAKPIAILIYRFSFLNTALIILYSGPAL